MRRLKSHCKRGHPRTPDNLTSGFGCKICAVGAQRKHRKEHLEKVRETGRKSDRKRRHKKYGLTEAEYEEMSSLQNNVCAICNKPCQTGKRLSVDHNHDTGKVRDLLCIFCNRFVGSLEKDVARTQAALNYLEKHRGRA